jgi:WD40 repeat protein
MIKICIGNSWLSRANSFQAHSEQINLIKQSPFDTNLNYVATCSYDGTVKIWESSYSFNWTLIMTYSNHSSGVIALEWLDLDTLASSGLNDQSIQVWSLTTGQTKLTINATKQYVFSLKLLNNKIHLAAGLGYPYDINIYNTNDGNLVSSLTGHSSYVYDLVQISDDLLASSGGYSDNTVRIWNLTTNTCKFNLTGHTGGVKGLKQITSSILASVSDDRTIKLWDITSGQLIIELTGHKSLTCAHVDLKDSQTLASGSSDGEIKLWDWSTGQCLSTIKTYSAINALAVIGIY